MILGRSDCFSKSLLKRKMSDFHFLHFKRIRCLDGYECNVKIRVLFFIVSVTLAKTAGFLSNI